MRAMLESSARVTHSDDAGAYVRVCVLVCVCVFVHIQVCVLVCVCVCMRAYMCLIQQR